MLARTLKYTASHRCKPGLDSQTGQNG